MFVIHNYTDDDDACSWWIGSFDHVDGNGYFYVLKTRYLQSAIAWCSYLNGGQRPDGFVAYTIEGDPFGD